MKRARLVAAVCTAAALTVAGCGTGPAAKSAASSGPLHAKLPKSVQDAGELKIGGSTNVAPYLYRDGAEVSGFEKDLMDALGTALGVKVQFFDTGFAALVPGLQSGKLDVAMGDFTDTLERQRVVTYVDYTTSYQTLFTQKGNPKRLASPDDLCGTTVSAAVGSLSATVSEQQNVKCRKSGRPGVTVLGMDTSTAAMMQVLTKRADALVTDLVIARHAAENNGKGDVAGEPFYRQFHGAAVDKDNVRLREALVAAFEELIRNGTYDRILKDWGMQKMAMPAPRVNAATS
ncbi:ABC transporter glutamine-binding protein GlnH precursor [Streptomyces sp. YIM 130001]|uniref:ABC transporter substrate-binding protein n=1 Tax=Streptomyces sp. YIM 130001 TaxID=2259644 RepID=UPI000E6563E6|nr:ABC transporter substrate-binding protein [Streptomyces sp. YIM 130001]RII20596.1 ABC transporter glutamine-binding protein GlnH precursor [Streptomyces sp. YIM 130001]